ncbi:MAG: hypothetical protein MPI95_00360 [Nitrosopumilus sp.]|nr:hypothetical protein [Nitrosopumilus sp.]CAI9831326.1 conserved hypothetical protein [Nitrosopumilaceae archaeon]MDA7940934.1 hypothetical protein [Nitrosopumilus sp.]MDA7943210.1 hypothetical protein [Nitrosopumilus sp.]MDA7944297.1 hypothetical protein [Nitrosopumilus sp.]
MAECPACGLAMESHSTAELLECCSEQAGPLEPGTCPGCLHGIEMHTGPDLAECMLDFLSHAKS